VTTVKIMRKTLALLAVELITMAALTRRVLRAALLAVLAHSFTAAVGISLLHPVEVDAQTYRQPSSIRWRTWNQVEPGHVSATVACNASLSGIYKDRFAFHHVQPSAAAFDPLNQPARAQDCYVTDLVYKTVGFWNTYGSFWWCVNGRNGGAGTGTDSAKLCVEGTDVPDPNNDGCIEEKCPRSASSGNPIRIATGNKYQTEGDYLGAGILPLQILRHYNSRQSQLGDATGVIGSFGRTWRGYYDRRVYGNARTGVGGFLSAYVVREDRRVHAFWPGAGAWDRNGNVQGKLTPLLDVKGVVTGWTYVEPESDLTETYDADGNLVSIANRAGVTQTMSYTDGKLVGVTDAFGRTLTFTYNASGYVQTITGPDTGVYQYAYDAVGNLTTVTYPDGRVRTYHYNEPAYMSGANLPHALTGITDELGNRFATYTYAADGRATRTERAAGTYAFTLVYNGDGSVTETDPQGATRTFGFQVKLGVPHNTSASGAPTKSYPTAALANSTGYRTSAIDWNGNRTNYTIDVRGLETSRTEGLTAAGASTAVTRTTETDWHATFRLPVQVREKNAGGPLLRRTANSYDTAGNLLTRTVTDVPAAKSRTWTYTYNANGQVLTADGPRTDTSDVTAYTYYANNATCSGASATGCRGQLASVTNAAGHVTQVTEYNAHGQPLSMTDANGLVTTMAYDARQRLTSRSMGGETTAYTYDNAGQLTRVTLPDGSYLNYTYDPAQRLTQIADSLGNRIAYTLDAMGNRTAENVYDPSNALAQTRTRVYNNLNRLTQDIGAAGQTTAYAYDNQGNVTGIDGPLAGAADTTINAYDQLNRLIRVTDPNSGQVNYGYNPLDQMVSVADPRSLATTYAYDALDNLNQLSSPDTGATVNTYDAAGNLLTSTDAKGQLTTYSYDALNRVTQIAYQGGLTHSYQYDQGSYGKGRLTKVTDPSGVTDMVYDQKGRLTSEARTIAGVTYTTSYSYDSAGRMTGITYPSGRQVAYTLDSLGRIQQVATTKDSLTQTVINNVAYRPFGPTRAYTFGNGQTYTRGFDQDGRIASYTLANQTIAVGFDTASRIAFLSDAGNPANTSNYGYDLLDRLTSYSNTSVNQNQSFGYDAVGNRTSLVKNAAASTYSYGATSNKLTGITGANPRSYTYDANGSTTADSVNSYTYDVRGRMVQAVNGGNTTNYALNAMGQRVRKTNAQGDTVYIYDREGRLIQEASNTGQVRKEYLYLGDIPIGVIQ